MSYCVNCGVELDASIKSCPLCNTPVINPKELHKFSHLTPFPPKKGIVEQVKRKDLAVLLSIILIATSITCGLLNFLVYSENNWSLLIIGICAVIWVFFIPVVIYTKLSAYTSLLLDGIVMIAFLGLITTITASAKWYYELAIPIVILLTCLLEIMLLLLKKVRIAFLTTAIYIFSELAILCIGLEILIDLYLDGTFSLSWSAVVLTVCTIIVITLTTLVSKRRFRDAVRRRLHF